MTRKDIPKKRKVTDSLRDLSPYDLEYTLEELQARIAEWILEYGPSARLDWDPYFQYEYEPNPSPRFYIKVDREETDEELKARLELEATRQAAREAQERADFERLSKKFKNI